MSYIFDGSSDRLYPTYEATAEKLSGSYQFPLTLACYIKWGSSGDGWVHPIATKSAVAIGKTPDSGVRANSIEIGLAANDNDIRSISFDGSTVSTNRISTVDVGTSKDNVWIPIVAVLSGSGNDLSDVTIYAVDYSTSNSTFSSAITGIGPINALRIGEGLDRGGDWLGKIAEVALWDTALSQTDIENYMDGSVNPSQIAASNLKIYYSLASDATQTGGTDTAGTLTVENNAAYDSDHPTIAAAATKYLKLLAHSSAASAQVVGEVSYPSSGGGLSGDKIGEFSTTHTFSSTLTAGYAILKIPVADFGGGALATSASAEAVVRNDTYTTGRIGGIIIEE